MMRVEQSAGLGCLCCAHFSSIIYVVGVHRNHGNLALPTHNLATHCVGPGPSYYWLCCAKLLAGSCSLAAVWSLLRLMINNLPQYHESYNESVLGLYAANVLLTQMTLTMKPIEFFLHPLSMLVPKTVQCSCNVAMVKNVVNPI